MTNATAREGAQSEIEPVDEFGLPEYSRRLKDKVLAAFNHAYASGEVEIAERLRDILEAVQSKDAAGTKAEVRRRSDDALGQADLWVGFVDARNHYNAASTAKRPESGAIDSALADMKEAYRRWSYG